MIDNGRLSGGRGRVSGVPEAALMMAVLLMVAASGPVRAQSDSRGPTVPAMSSPAASNPRLVAICRERLKANQDLKGDDLEGSVQSCARKLSLPAEEACREDAALVSLSGKELRQFLEKCKREHQQTTGGR